MKKVRLKKGILRKFGFGVGGDMSESVAIAVDGDGNPIKYRDINKHKGMIFTRVFDCRDEETDYLVVDHPSPIPKESYERFSQIFEDVEPEIEGAQKLKGENGKTN